MKKGLVSVIVPIFNTEKYLKKCLDSIVCQTYSNIEIILINDGSTDNSLKIAKEYSNDERVAIIDKKNTGPSESRNIGIDAANGEYICFVDSDDWIETDMISRMMEIAGTGKCNLVICGITDAYEETKQCEKPPLEYALYDSEQAIEFLVTEATEVNISSSPCNKLIKKELLEKIKFEVGKFYEDVLFVCKLIIEAEKMAYDNQKSYYYRTARPGSTTTTRRNELLFSDFLPALDNRSKEIKKAGYENAYEIDRFNYYYHIFEFLLSATLKRDETCYKYFESAKKELKNNKELKYLLKSHSISACHRKKIKMWISYYSPDLLIKIISITKGKDN